MSLKYNSRCPLPDFSPSEDWL